MSPERLSKEELEADILSALPSSMLATDVQDCIRRAARQLVQGWFVSRPELSLLSLLWVVRRLSIEEMYAELKQTRLRLDEMADVSVRWGWQTWHLEHAYAPNSPAPLLQCTVPERWATDASGKMVHTRDNADIEFYVLRGFLANCPVEIGAKPLLYAEKCIYDPPDFVVIDGDGKRIGVEITQATTENDMRQRSVGDELWELLFHMLDEMDVYVSITYRLRSPLPASHAGISKLARRMADAIATRIGANNAPSEFPIGDPTISRLMGIIARVVKSRDQMTVLRLQDLDPDPSTDAEGWRQSVREACGKKFRSESEYRSQIMTKASVESLLLVTYSNTHYHVDRRPDVLSRSVTDLATELMNSCTAPFDGVYLLFGETVYTLARTS